MPVSASCQRIAGPPRLLLSTAEDVDWQQNCAEPGLGVHNARCGLSPGRRRLPPLLDDRAASRYSRILRTSTMIPTGHATCKSSLVAISSLEVTPGVVIRSKSSLDILSP